MNQKVYDLAKEIVTEMAKEKKTEFKGYAVADNEVYDYKFKLRKVEKK